MIKNIGKLNKFMGAVAAALCVVATAPAVAQYPEQPVRIIVPFAPGGNIDAAARMLSTYLAEKLGQPFIVENRSGAGGSIGAQAVAQSRPDGYVVLSGSNGMLAVNPAVNPSLPYDPVKSSGAGSFYFASSFSAHGARQVARQGSRFAEGIRSLQRHPH